MIKYTQRFANRLNKPHICLVADKTQQRWNVDEWRCIQKPAILWNSQSKRTTLKRLEGLRVR